MVIGVRLLINRSAFVYVFIHHLLYSGINVMKPSVNNIVGGFFSRNKTYFLWNSWIPCFQCRNVNLGLGGTWEDQGYSSLTKHVYSGNADFFCPKRRFRTVFVSFSNRIVLCRFKRRLKEKRRLNGVFPFSQSQGIGKIAIYLYRFKRSSLSFILLTNQ